MIPKIIHFCWFGGNPLPKLEEKCMESWVNMLPEYKLMKWDEQVFDIDSAPTYVRQAYEAKKFAFVSDYVRLFALYNYGGIYLDTDVEVIKSFNPVLDCEGFVSVEENTRKVATCVMGSIQYSNWTKDFLSIYANRSFVNDNGSFDLTPNVDFLTNLLIKKGWNASSISLSYIDQYMTIYPSDFFCPKQLSRKSFMITKNTYCIHHFSGSWLPFKKRIKVFIYRLIGAEFISKLKSILNK